MLILTIRTDKPEAEIGLYENAELLAYETWQAHRELAETLHLKIQELLEREHKAWKDIRGIAAYEGPGSFTGLRIGLSTANALAYALQVPVVAAGGDSWVQDALGRLAAGENDRIAQPEYGSPPHITPPKK